MPYENGQITETKVERAKVLASLRKLDAKAKEEGRSLTAEEKEEWRKAFDDVHRLRDEAERMEQLNTYERELEEAARAEEKSKEQGNRRSVSDPPGDAGAEDAEDQQRGSYKLPDGFEKEIFGEGLRKIDLRQLLRKDPTGTPEFADAYYRYLCAQDKSDGQDARHEARRIQRKVSEQRDLSVSDDAQAGVLTPPLQLQAEIIAALDKTAFVQSWSRRFTVRQAQSLGAPKRDARASTWAWGSELSEPTADTALSFGMRKLHPHPATGEIKASRDFLRMALISPESMIRDEIAFGSTELVENAVLTGTGEDEPLGVFTASTEGISTSRDVSTGNTSTAVTIDGVRAAKYAMRHVYWPTARWLVCQEVHEDLYTADDNDNRPLWAESVRAGEPDRLLGLPVYISEYVPNTMTTGQYVGMLGDWRYYWTAWALDMEIQRLDELHARTNQVGWIARLKMDGMPVLEEPFVRIKLA